MLWRLAPSHRRAARARHPARSPLPALPPPSPPRRWERARRRSRGRLGWSYRPIELASPGEQAVLFELEDARANGLATQLAEPHRLGRRGACPAGAFRPLDAQLDEHAGAGSVRESSHAAPSSAAARARSRRQVFLPCPENVSPLLLLPLFPELLRPRRPEHVSPFERPHDGARALQRAEQGLVPRGQA